MNAVLMLTQADEQVRECLAGSTSFAMIAGAGSGKTTSLLTALDHIRDTFGRRMRRDGQRAVCVTYTNRAVDVISSRLGWDDLFLVTTLHGFLWEEIKRFPKEIRKCLQDSIIPGVIEAKRHEDNGGNSKKAVAARQKIEALQGDLEALGQIDSFRYGNSNFSNYAAGELGHDDVIAVAAWMLEEFPRLRRVVGQKYPYIFVDEAQDTHESVVAALNRLCAVQGALPLVGYFGDPMQQIYDKRAGGFSGPDGARQITKVENFRCAPEVVRLLNALRADVQQVPAGGNANVEGSVCIRLIEAEAPGAPRGRYTQEQLQRASDSLDAALNDWGWADRADVKHLYLVRQMIARRMGFSNVHALFTGPYASSRATDDYENGEHFLLKPFTECLYSLLKASEAGAHRQVIDILRRNSPEFDPAGRNAKSPLGDMRARASLLIAKLVELWGGGSAGDVLRFGRENGLFDATRRLEDNLARAPRVEQYDEEVHAQEKGEWLADKFLSMDLVEVGRFCEFMTEKTVFSTQHGVKGEEYEDVLVVFDDIGSAWSNYSFSKTLAPQTSGAPTDRQRKLSENLAYVCFSRAERNLRIVMFIGNAGRVRDELIQRGLFDASQIEVSA